MLIKKEQTNYGYTARIRYDVKLPAIHVIEQHSKVKLSGVADITIITGTVSITRKDGTKNALDRLETKDTYRIPADTDVTITAQTKTVLLEDNSSTNKVEDYLKLTVIEDEPSSDDLQYIEDE